MKNKSVVHYYRTEPEHYPQVWVAADEAGWLPGSWRFKWVARIEVMLYRRRFR